MKTPEELAKADDQQVLEDSGLNEWIRWLERNRGVGPKGDSFKCPETGGFYREILWTLVQKGSSDGDCYVVTPNGQSCKRVIFCEHAEDAIALWRIAFERYLAGRTGKLCWRVRPEVIRDGGFWTVYARIFIPEDKS